MCTHSLRTDFLGSSTGGTWTYIGFNETSSTGPFTSNASTPPAALAGVPPIVLVGDNPSVDWNGADDGFYHFTYNLGSCGGSVSLTVSVIDSCFNPSVTVNVHNQQTSIDLNALVVDGLLCTKSKGYWKFQSGTLPAFNPVTGIFNPSLTATGSTHILHYVVASNCTDCKSVITINVYDCDNNDLCHYFTDFSETLEQEDLDDSQILSFKVGGEEQLTSPITGFGVKNVITYGAKPYLTNLVDTLNGLDVDCFQFYYSTVTVGAETRQKFARFCIPQNIDWEIKLYCAGGAATYFVYNQSGVSFSYDDVTYFTMFGTNFYNIASGITTGIESCTTTSSCE